MKELKLSAAPKLKVILPDGSECVIRQPNLGEAEELEAIGKEDGWLKRAFAFLEKLGLPEAKARSLEVLHLEEILGALMPEKKP